MFRVFGFALVFHRNLSNVKWFGAQIILGNTEVFTYICNVCVVFTTYNVGLFAAMLCT